MKKIICTLLILGATQLGPGGTVIAATSAAATVAATSAATVAATAATPGVQSFSDVSNSHWACEPVAAMASRGIIKGYPDKTFKPEKLVTYGEFIKMASLIGNGKDEGNAAGEAWAINYYNELLGKGFYTSFDIPEIKLNWTISRGDMALVIGGLIGNEKIEDFQQVERNITDINSATKHEVEIVKAYAAGILKGYPDRTFRPEETLSRAEAATALYRMVQQKSEKDIFSFISNMEDYRKETWLDTDKYKFVMPEEVGMKLRVPWNGRVAGFDHTMIGFIYLVKGDKIIEYCRSIPAETFITTASHFELEKFDYMMCIPSKHGTQTHILITKNPFKKQV